VGHEDSGGTGAGARRPAGRAGAAPCVCAASRSSAPEAMRKLSPHSAGTPRLPSFRTADLAAEPAISVQREGGPTRAEVVRGLAARGREKMSGNFRAAVFGANDGLVSNFALVLGVMGAGGIDSNIILLTGISGMLAGALSMGAGEYISVKSQNELLEASHPHLATSTVVPQLDVDANELALVYRARGMSADEAKVQADKVFAQIEQSKSVDAEMLAGANMAEEETLSNPWMVAFSSFLCFGAGALLPVLPFFVDLPQMVAGVIATALVGIALMVTGAITGILSGKPPFLRAIRQLVVGMLAAGVTYALGMLFGVAIG